MRMHTYIFKTFICLFTLKNSSFLIPTYFKHTKILNAAITPLHQLKQSISWISKTSVNWLESLQLVPINNVWSMKLLHTKNRKKDMKNELTFTRKPILYKFKNVKTFLVYLPWHGEHKYKAPNSISIVISR